MEDIVTYIIIIGAIAVSIIKQVGGLVTKQSDDQPAVPMKEPWQQMEWEEEAELAPVPMEPVPASQVKTSAPQKAASKPFIPQSEKTTHRSISDNLKRETSASPLMEAEEEISEFAIHNAEEARRAIIYSEILQRKY